MYCQYCVLYTAKKNLTLDLCHLPRLNFCGNKIKTLHPSCHEFWKYTINHLPASYGFHQINEKQCPASSSKHCKNQNNMGPCLMPTWGFFWHRSYVDLTSQFCLPDLPLQDDLSPQILSASWPTFNRIIGKQMTWVWQLNYIGIPNLERAQPIITGCTKPEFSQIKSVLSSKDNFEVQ